MPWLFRGDRLWEGTTRAEDAQGTPTQSHISPNILVYQEEMAEDEGGDDEEVLVEHISRLTESS